MKHLTFNRTRCTFCKVEIQWPFGLCFENPVKIKDGPHSVTYYVPPLFLCDEHEIWYCEDKALTMHDESWPGPESVKTIRIRKEDTNSKGLPKDRIGWGNR